MGEPSRTDAKRGSGRPTAFRLGTSLTLVVVFVLLVAASQLASYFSFKKLLDSAVHGGEISKIKSISAVLNNLIQARTVQVAQVAQLLARQDSLSRFLQKRDDASQQELSAILKDARGITDVDLLEVTDTHERVIYNAADASKTGRVATMWGVSEALDGRGMLSSDTGTDGVSICAIEPVRIRGSIIGSLVACMRLNEKFIARLGREVGADLALLSRSGRIVVSEPGVEERIDHSAVRETFDQKIPIYGRSTDERHARVYLPLLIVDEAYVLLVQIDSSEALGLLTRNIHQSAINAVSILAVGILLGLICLRFILRPLRRLRINAEETAVALTGSAIPADTKDEVLAVVRVMETLTHRLVQQNTELSEANARLKELDKVKSEIVSSVSHEMRTPMTSIWGFAKIIQRDFAKIMDCEDEAMAVDERDTLSRRIMGNLGIIISEGQRLTNMIGDFLDLAKIASGNILWQDRLTGPAELAQNAGAAARGLFDEKPEVRFSLLLEPGLPPVMADPERLHQVLLNLISNAVKFTEKGNVELSVTSEGAGAVLFKVRDTGAGISQQERELVFKPFYQSIQGSSLENKPKGTGLGLSICLGILEHYGSEMRLESEVGVGSVFSFTLPAASSEEGA